MDDVVLRQVPEQAAEGVEVSVQIDPVEANLTAIGRPDACQRLQQHRLPRAATADDRDQLGGTDGQRDVVEHGFAALDHLPETAGGDLDPARCGDRDVDFRL